jgi:outer membrane protein assembly factor BamB
VLILNRATGATLYTFPAPPSVVPEDIDANGRYLALTDANTAEIWDIDNAAPSLVPGIVGAPIAHGAAVRAVALGWEYLFFGGDNGTGGNDVRAARLSDGGLQWSYIIPQTGGPTPICQAICTDGERVYVGGIAVIDGANVSNVWCLEREGDQKGIPTLLWRALVEDSDVRALAVDERWLYVNDTENDGLTVLDKKSGAHIWTTDVFLNDCTSIVVDGRVCDGPSTISRSRYLIRRS